MKHIKYIKTLILIVIASSFFSCLGSLDPVINDKIIPNNFFKNENDARAALTSIYYPFNTSWSGGGFFSAYVSSYLCLSNLSSDDMGLTRNDLDVVEKFLWNANTSQVANHYSNWVKYVSSATLLIDDLKNTTMNEDRKSQFIGEVQCARAQFMFCLYDFYGTAGVVMDPNILRNTETEVILERLSKEDFVKLIESDLLAATKILPDKYPSNEWGRFTKGAAYAILMKLYMQEKRWSDAEKTGREILKLGYELQDSYSSVFAVDNEKNNELIWAVPCLAEGGYGNMWITHIAPPEYTLVNTKIQRWFVYNTPWRFYDKYEKADERLKTLVGEFMYIPKGATVPILATRHNFEHLKKGALPIKYPEDPKQTGDYSGNDLVIYRYADVLLGLAEVINEQSGPTTEATELVMDIRRRVGLNESLPPEYTASKDAFRDFILDERGRELYCEGHRRRDLIRHGKFISTAHEEGYATAKPHMELFPLPQVILDESKGKIKQNSGY